MARSSEAALITCWPTMMIERRTSWMKVCEIHWTVVSAPLT